MNRHEDVAQTKKSALEIVTLLKDVHHPRARSTLVKLIAGLEGSASSAGLKSTFRHLAQALMTHMDEEERVVFPAVDRSARGLHVDKAEFIDAIAFLEFGHGEIGRMEATLREEAHQFGGLAAPLVHFLDELEAYSVLEDQVLVPLLKALVPE